MLVPYAAMLFPEASMKTIPQPTRRTLLVAAICIVCGGAGLWVSYWLLPRSDISFSDYLTSLFRGIFAPHYRFDGAVRWVALTSLVIGVMFGYLAARRLVGGATPLPREPLAPPA